MHAWQRPGARVRPVVAARLRPGAVAEGCEEGRHEKQDSSHCVLRVAAVGWLDDLKGLNEIEGTEMDLCGGGWKRAPYTVPTGILGGYCTR